MLSGLSCADLLVSWSTYAGFLAERPLRMHEKAGCKSSPYNAHSPQ
ncbi:Uncharacterised protein [Vibrio cholerae]|nr:Uncharacterised protein [Vibrio cholerae]